MERFKDKKSRILITFLMLMIITLLSGIEVQAASKTKVHKAYEKRIKSINKKWNKFYQELGTNKGTNYFAYKDINRDGTDELIILHHFYDNGENTTERSSGTDVAIYTYYKGKVKKLLYETPCGGTMGGIVFSKDSKYIGSYVKAGTYETHFTYYSIKKGKLVKKKTLHRVVNYDRYFSTGEEIYSYKYNNKKITKKRYEKLMKKYSGEDYLKMYKITKKNMKKNR